MRFSRSFFKGPVWRRDAGLRKTSIRTCSPGSQERWGETAGGTSGGGEAVKLLVSMDPRLAGPLDALCEMLHISRRCAESGKVKKCLRSVGVQSSPEAGPHRSDLRQVNRFFWGAVPLASRAGEGGRSAGDRSRTGGRPRTIRPSILCQLGLERFAGNARFPDLPVELANDCVGYVPTEEALGRMAAGTRHG